MFFNKKNAKRDSTVQDEPLKKVMQELNILKRDRRTAGQFLASPLHAAPLRPRISGPVRLAIGNLSDVLEDPKNGIQSEVEALCKALDREEVQETVQVTEALLDEEIDMSRTESVVSSLSSSSEEYLELDEAAFAFNKALMERARMVANGVEGGRAPRQDTIKAVDVTDKGDKPAVTDGVAQQAEVTMGDVNNNDNMDVVQPRGEPASHERIVGTRLRRAGYGVNTPDGTDVVNVAITSHNLNYGAMTTNATDREDAVSVGSPDRETEGTSQTSTRTRSCNPQ